MLPRGEKIAMPRAVHRLYPVLSIFHVHQKHVVVESLIMPRSLPQVSFVNEWGDDLCVPVTTIKTLDILDEEIVDDRSFWMKEGRTGRNWMKREKV
jgi:hypothetical protein